MTNQKTLVDVQVILFGEVLVANPLERETEKAYCIQVSNGKYLGQTSGSLWIPKSIVTEKVTISKPDSDGVVVVTKKLTVPEWFADKNIS